jgi:hypothetical protein
VFLVDQRPKPGIRAANIVRIFNLQGLYL